MAPTDGTATRPASANAVVDYDPAWTTQFDAIAAAIQPALRDGAFRVEHVGSTSVPGLAAKPIIDVHVEVPTTAQISDAVDRLSQLGYRHQGDGDIPGREVMKPPAAMPYHHLYVVTSGSKPHLDHLLFRDFLRRDPSAATAYADRKREIAHLITATSRDAYIHAKTETVERILRRARATLLGVRAVEPRDAPQIRRLLIEWFEELTPGRVETEVDERIEALGRARRATVVVHDDTVLGIGAISDRELDADLGVDSERPVEVFCVYVRRDGMRQGVGGLLLDDLEANAAGLGCTDVIAISGARHRTIGYPFWNARYGEPIRVDENYWGDGAERVVWRRRLAG